MVARAQSTDDDSEESSRKRPYLPVFCDKYRYFLLFLGLFCLTSINANMATLNFTLICMVNPPSNSSSPANSTIIFPPPAEINKDIPMFDYTKNQKEMLMHMAAIGSVLGTFPFSAAYSRWGARRILFLAGLASAFATALIPLAAIHSGLIVFNALRVIQGLAYSADFAAMGMLCSRWASLKQNAIFISVLTCFSPLASTLTNPVSGMLCNSRYGWPMVYYVHAAVSTLLFVLWAIFYSDHPRESVFVSDVELETINRGKTKAHITGDGDVPYKKILTDPVVWTVWFNAFADLFSGVFLLMYMPTYLKYVLNFGVEKTGFLGALPSLAHIPVKIVLGFCSDKFRCIPERSKLVLFNTIAVAVPALFYLGVAFTPADQPILVVLMFSIIFMLLSANGAGFYKCGALYSRQYAHFVIACMQFMKSLTLFVGPTLMAIFVTDEHQQEQWRYIYVIMAGMLLIANALFWRYATDQPAKFTIQQREDDG